MSFRPSAMLLAFLGTTLSVVDVRAQSFVELSRRLPTGANAAIVVNAEALYDSPLGKKENWRQKFADATESAPLMLPPKAQRAVLAAELEIESLRPEWEAAVMTLSIDPTLEQVAERHEGMVDDIGDVGAVWLPPNLCIVKFAPHLFGLLTEANRQEATRWIDEATDKRDEPLSPYLEESVRFADTAGTQLILAVDLAGSFHVQAVREAVARSTVLDGLSEETATKLFVGIRGVKFGVIATDKLNAKLQFDFAADAAALAPVAKPLALAILTNAGAMLDEFNGWTAKVQGNSLSLEGELTPAGLRRVFSLLSLDASVIRGDETPAPAANAGGNPRPKAAPPTPAELTARASLRYFKAVDKYIQDSKNLNRAGSVQQAAMWLENFARRIDNLSTRNVDPDLVKFGAYTSQTFRYVVDLAYGIEDKMAQQAAPEQPVTYQIGYVPTFRTVNWGGYFMRQYAPYYNAQFDAQADREQRQRNADEMYQLGQQAKQALAELATNVETVRKNLAAKYSLKF